MFLSKIPGGRCCNCISDKYLWIRRKFSTLNKGQSWDVYKVINQMTSGINSVLNREIKMVQPCTYVLIFSLLKTSKVLSVVLILTQLCTLWRRNKLLIRPRKQSSSYIGLRPPFGPFPMIDELKQALFFLGGSSYDNLWFAVSFPNLLLRKRIAPRSPPIEFAPSSSPPPYAVFAPTLFEFDPIKSSSPLDWVISRWVDLWRRH